MKKSSKVLVLCLSAAVVGAGALTGWLLAQRGGKAVTASSGAVGSAAVSASSSGSGLGSTAVENGVTYTRRTDLQTVLFLGVDKSQSAKSGDTIGQNGRSDTMVLFVLDKTNRTMQMLEISRDTMTGVDVYSNSGTFLYTAEMQLTMQYAFGVSAANGCRLTKTKVSQLLCGMPVSAVLSLTMDGIAAVVDSVGGVTVTIPSDATAVDPSFTAGAAVTMTGAQAYSYIRWRDTAEAGSNNDRMQRQVAFFKALESKLRAGDAAALADTLKKAAEPYLESDLDADTIDRLAHYTLLDTVLQLPGENVAGELHDEYHPDTAAIRTLVLQLFYTAGK